MKHNIIPKPKKYNTFNPNNNYTWMDLCKKIQDKKFKSKEIMINEISKQIKRVFVNVKYGKSYIIHKINNHDRMFDVIG